MKQITLILLLFLLSSCSELTNEEKIQKSFDCEFEQIDENQDGIIDEQESELMSLCINEAFTSKSEIEENLLGEWILVGHAAGFLANESQPCAYIIIEEDQLVFKFENAVIDSIYTSSWEVKEVSTATSSNFVLSPTENINLLRMTNFSPQYMFTSNSAVDGYTYIYEKSN